MRCFIKKYYFYPTGSLCGGVIEPFYRLYQNEDWDFTGKIKYQTNYYGQTIVSFEVNDSNGDEWHEEEEFDFDDSTAAVIVDCNSA